MINLEKPKEKRECGDCEVCCTVMGVDIIGKKPMIPCHYLHKTVTLGPLQLTGCASYDDPPKLHGCSIYDTKPECCTEFKCLWLHGAVGNDDDRPNQLGVMFDYLRSADTIAKVGNIIIAYEVTPGALSTERVQYWIKKMSEKMPIILNYLGGKKTITGRKSLLDKILVIKDGNIMIH